MKNICGFVVGAGLMALTSGAAHAGYYEETTTVVGSTAWGTSSTLVNPTYTTEHDSLSAVNYHARAQVEIQAAPGLISVQDTAYIEIQRVFTWTPDYVGDTSVAPTTLNVKRSASLTGKLYAKITVNRLNAAGSAYAAVEGDDSLNVPSGTSVQTPTWSNFGIYDATLPITTPITFTDTEVVTSGTPINTLTRTYRIDISSRADGNAGGTNIAIAQSGKATGTYNDIVIDDFFVY